MTKLPLALFLAACGGAAPPNNHVGAYRDPAVSAPAVRDWVVIGTGVPAVNLQQQIMLTQPRAFGQLLVKGVSGAPEIQQIEIQYDDKSVHTVTLDRTLPEGEGQVIELRDRRAIMRLTVFTDPDGQGSYSVFGS
ncbi:MAG TPA: hypothetical protein VIU61_22150 [Kofleriaceae bacterium]